MRDTGRHGTARRLGFRDQVDLTNLIQSGFSLQIPGIEGHARVFICYQVLSE